MKTKLYRALNDHKNGGPARAFECLVAPLQMSNVTAHVSCGRVTKTKRGMILHLLFAHGIKLQRSMFE